MNETPSGRPRIQPAVLTPDAAYTEIDDSSLQREIIFAAAKSLIFYRSLREIICTYDPRRRSHRQDFTVRRYQHMFVAVDTFWRRFDGKDNPEDRSIPPFLLSAFIADGGNTGRIPLEDAQELVDEIRDEAPLVAEITLESSMALLDSAGFKHWLEKRILAHTYGRLAVQKTAGVMTLSSLETLMTSAKMAMSPVNSSSFENSAFTLRRRQVYRRAVKTDLPGLDAAMGGGFRRGEATLIAAINGGGKTVLCCQLAIEFAYNQLNVAYFTTERRPFELLTRMVSNKINIEYGRLINRPELDDLQDDCQEHALLPEWVWTDPSHVGKMTAFEDTISSRLLMVDWSRGQGKSITGSFEAEIQQMERLGWSPDVIIFDWIGGGLGQLSDKDKLRLLYQDGMDALVSHGKRTDRIMIAAAQLDKNQVKPGVKAIEMRMLAECKAMTNNITNFIGISSMSEKENGSDGKPRLNSKQWLNLDKATMGPGGLVSVIQNFGFQRFEEARRMLGSVV